MKQVWKCDHCYKTDDDSKVIESHEPTCFSNPELKGCWTCKHHEDEGMPISGSMYVCKAGNDFETVWDFEKHGGCDKWKSPKES